MSLPSAARTTRRVEYPTSDGKPMAETDPPRRLRLLMKPYRKADLATTLRDVLDR